MSNSNAIYSVFDLKKGCDFIEMVFVLNIYLYLNEERIDDMTTRFYAGEPVDKATYHIMDRVSNLISGVLPSIITKNKICDITEKEMIAQAVKRNLEKQHRNKVKVNNMDDEARITHKIFRLHNLGDNFSNIGEEQQYLDGDAISRDTVPGDQGETSGDLDQIESELLTNNGAEEPDEM